ncbi:DUF6376 family protein [Paenactinomyces guangxiensis]|uniref:Lipoprotein n=1 Tax=Paenactinomyces guangxiensis TaxID=1490290 RepID=A0A7W2A8X4_9BACL|nr:DUF6376 family protein [Paenactinomyces guangxiensis]MBA4495080.1 hypothetical protein [Paenactinomyces guangxiensis]MBH8592236.1 hypothetical protein [Paenactinomyces guangxiensis]
MKKSLLVLLSILFVFAAGCSVVEDVTNTIEYADEAAQYAQVITDFYNTAPSLVEQATTDPASRQELETKLKNVKQEIQDFNQLTPPENVQEYHDVIVGHNKQLETVIDTYLDNVKDGKIDPKLLENADLLQSIEDISKAVNDIQNIGK